MSKLNLQKMKDILGKGKGGKGSNRKLSINIWNILLIFLGIFIAHIIGFIVLFVIGWLVALCWNNSLSMYVGGISDIDYKAGVALVILVSLLNGPSVFFTIKSSSKNK